FVRYAIVPWRDNVIGSAEQGEFALHCFRSIYGDVASNWEIRVSAGGFRRNSLASAVDVDMLRAVERTLAERGISVASIQPNFMATCNRYRRELSGHASASIAVLEPRRVTLGIYDRKGWRYLSTRRLATLGPKELVPVIAQELRSLDACDLPENLFVAAFGPTTNSFFRTRIEAWMLPSRTSIPEPVA
ncbi:MAG TPA: hypothetical protein VHB46_18190, partial [Burkholderiales bacterium]|nr:hypothetical protein [Burkholderiales bacterium]